MSATGAITHHIDIAQAVLYMFWVFFASLIYYLHRENKREGYPLVYDGRQGSRVVVHGFPATPEPKTFRMRNGDVFLAPGPNSAPQELVGAVSTSSAAGSPIVPTGNPLLDAVGPAAYAGSRDDKPETTLDDQLRIVPLRDAPGFGVVADDPDPRGKPVYGADGQVGGVVRDLWVDRSEAFFRYVEIAVDTPTGERIVLLPTTLARFSDGGVKVASILGSQFADAPVLKSPGAITRLEEDKVSAYYGGGTLYATPARQEPLL